MGFVISLFMICSGGWLLSIPLYLRDGLFVVLFGAMTVALVLMTNAAILRFQKWAIDYSNDINAALLERKSTESSTPQIVEEESFDEFEVSEQLPFEEKKETLEEEIWLE